MQKVRNAEAVHNITRTEVATGRARADEAEDLPDTDEEPADDSKTETAEAFDAAVVPDCIGKTKAGKPCKSPAVAGSEYCFNHRDQQQEPSERSVVLDEGATEGAYTE